MSDGLTAACRYVACMNPTAGSFIINPRLQRLFMTLAVLTGHLKKFSAEVQVRPMIA